MGISAELKADSVLGFSETDWGQPSSTVRETLSTLSFVSLKNRYLFFAIPKAACTSLKRLLLSLEGVEPTFVSSLESKPTMLVHLRKAYPFTSLLGVPPADIHRVLYSEDFLRFAVVRNPYSRLISVWRNKICFEEPVFLPHIRQIRKILSIPNGRISFEQFIDYISLPEAYLHPGWNHWYPQRQLIYSHIVPYSFIGKIENIEETLARLSQHLSKPDFLNAKLSQENASFAIRPWQEEYTPLLAGRVFKLFEADFEAFDYLPESWLPNENSKTNTPAEQIDFLVSEIIQRNHMIEMIVSSHRNK